MDLQNSNKPDQIEVCVKQFNDEVSKYFNNVLPLKIVDVTYDTDDIPQMNSVSLPNVKYFLERYWLVGANFDHSFKGTLLWIENVIVANIISQESQGKLIDIINKLKYDKEIYSKISAFKYTRLNLQYKIEELLNQISNIIDEICEDCRK